MSSQESDKRQRDSAIRAYGQVYQRVNARRMELLRDPEYLRLKEEECVAYQTAEAAKAIYAARWHTKGKT